MKKLEFSLKLKEEPVELTGSNDVVEKCSLRELGGAERDTHLDDMAKRMKFVNGKAEGLTKYANLQAGLVALCLRGEDGKLKTIEQIQKYPSSVVQALYKAAQDLSGLSEAGEEDAKND